MKEISISQNMKINGWFDLVKQKKMETVACREKPVKKKKLIYAVGSGTDSANLSL